MFIVITLMCYVTVDCLWFSSMILVTSSYMDCCSCDIIWYLEAGFPYWKLLSITDKLEEISVVFTAVMCKYVQGTSLSLSLVCCRLLCDNHIRSYLPTVSTCSRWFARGFLIFLIPWRWKRYVPPKCRLTQYLHGATSQKTAFFIVTAVKTSSLTIGFKFVNADMY
jgi:hypothetical protein